MLPQQMYSTQISAPLNHRSGTDTGRDPNTSLPAWGSQPCCLLSPWGSAELSPV